MHSGPGRSSATTNAKLGREALRHLKTETNSGFQPVATRASAQLEPGGPRSALAYRLFRD